MYWALTLELVRATAAKEPRPLLDYRRRGLSAWCQREGYGHRYLCSHEDAGLVRDNIGVAEMKKLIECFAECKLILNFVGGNKAKIQIGK